jgi:hypothetical protein
VELVDDQGSVGSWAGSLLKSSLSDEKVDAPAIPTSLETAMTSSFSRLKKDQVDRFEAAA